MGDKLEAKKYETPTTNIIFLSEENMVLPGFVDSHLHPVQAGLQFLNCSVKKANNLEEALDIIQKFDKEHPNLPCIYVTGYYDSWYCIISTNSLV